VEASLDSLPLPLCGHDAALRRRGGAAWCVTCGSFWDLDSLGVGPAYDATYCSARFHSDVRTGRLKLRSLMGWLARTGIPVTGRAVCEVGFAGGHVLHGLGERGACVAGIEANPAALEAARALGIPADRLYAADRLPARLVPEVDVWLFLDSFEHLPDPRSFLSWLTLSSSRDAVALLVLPDANSWSARWLGRAWPHRLADHRFHWSRRGLEQLWRREGWRLRTRFVPYKWVSPATLAAHVLLQMRCSEPVLRRSASWLEPLQAVAVPFNVGEMGVVFSRAGGGGA
jgi:hypothetical protein